MSETQVSMTVSDFFCFFFLAIIPWKGELLFNGGGGGGGRFIYKLKEGAWEWASALMQGLSKKS